MVLLATTAVVANGAPRDVDSSKASTGAGVIDDESMLPEKRSAPFDPAPAGAAPGRPLGRPTALASGDFDEDGVPDLISGYATAEGGVLTLHRGNVDTIYPHSPSARQRRVEGSFSDAPFLSPAKPFELNSTPDFLGAGDFDNDGHRDVVVGTRSGHQLLFLAGDGEGNFSLSTAVELGGALTAMITGEINRADGLLDIVVGVNGEAGSAVRVYQGPRGALRSDAELIELPSAPSALALGRFDDDSFVDLAAGAGREMLIVRGRDRRLLQGAVHRESVQPAVAEQRFALASRVESIAWGDFVWEPLTRGELAVMTEDGMLQVVDLGRVAGPAELANGRAEEVGATKASPPLVLARRQFARGTERGPRATHVVSLTSARLSGLPTEDLVVLDPHDRRLHVLSGLMPSEGEPDSAALTSTVLEQDPVAMLPMRLNGDALTDLVLLQEGTEGPTVAVTSPQAVITVDFPGDNAIAGNGDCTLREAINNANSNSDTTLGDCAAGAGADRIEFAISGGGAVASIAVASSLPIITDSVTIDGTTQGCASPPCIEINGVLLGAFERGLRLTAGGNTIRGLIINRFPSHGIFGTSSGNFIEGSYIGTDVTGTIDQGNGGAGVRLENAGATANTIGGTVAATRNIVSGNSGAGVNLLNSGSDNLVLGNYIGTDVTGTLAVGNDLMGIRIDDTPGVRVGGTTPGERNVISGNLFDGAFITGDLSDFNQFSGNYIGTDVGGTTALPNGFRGIRILHGDENTIGGTAAGAGNLISGNGGAVSSVGIIIETSDAAVAATGNEVSGNLIGTDVSGTVDLGNTSVGVRIQSSPRNTVGGTVPEARNVISGNESDGIFIAGGGADSNQVLGNYIGTDITGGAALPNRFVGVEIQGGSNNEVGGADPGAGNLISGNGLSGGAIADAGVLIEEGDNFPTTGNSVLGNLIGTDATGMLDLGNNGIGVTIFGANGNFVGGDNPGEGNVISGNGSDGIYVVCRIPAPSEPCAGAADNRIRGNRIGTDATGSFAVPNDQVGVEIEGAPATGNLIGGATPGARNVISGNANDGVLLQAPQNVVSGNFIGTDATGTFDLGNALAGVEIEDGSDNTIGGNTPGERNVISGNGSEGVLIQQLEGLIADGNRILGNFIGTDGSGMAPIGNTRRGVVVLGGTDNEVGGIGQGDANLIAYNLEEGIGVFPGTIPPSSGPAIGNALLGNAIHSNGLLGIDLATAQPGSDGVTPNDPGDGDTGGNNLQNFPVLSLADASPVDVLIEGSLDSTLNTDFRIEFFASNLCDGSGHGEGERYLGFTNVSTPGSGTTSFSVLLTAPVSDADAVTATATDDGNNTSEFSECFFASCTTTVSFAQTIRAPDRHRLVWTMPADVRYARGDLAAVSSYATTGDGPLVAATFHDISGDHPAPNSGLYYVIKPLGCGSWQTLVGAEPGRDTGLP